MRYESIALRVPVEVGESSPLVWDWGTLLDTSEEVGVTWPTSLDVRSETGIETYVNDEPGDPNPGIIVDSSENRGRALSSSQARALAAELLARADYFDSTQKEA